MSLSAAADEEEEADHEGAGNDASTAAVEDHPDEGDHGDEVAHEPGVEPPDDA